MVAGNEPNAAPAPHEQAVRSAQPEAPAAPAPAAPAPTAAEPSAPILLAPQTPATSSARPRPARLALVPIIVGLVGLAAVSGIIVDLTQGQAAGNLGLAWLGVGLFVLFRLALLWQHKLNDTPLVPPRTGP